MVVKKNKLFIVILLGVFLIPFIFATTTLNSPATNSNWSATLNFTCVTDITNALNATLWYNVSGGTPNVSSTTVTNTSTGQTLFTSPAIATAPLEEGLTYSGLCEIWNSTDQENSSILTSITIDRTAPAITLPVYTNATAKNNTDTLTLNISVVDALSGELGSVCLIDVNGTSNQSVAVSNGWCNSSAINLTGSTDGNHTLKIYVNDTVANLGLNNSNNPSTS